MRSRNDDTPDDSSPFPASEPGAHKRDTVHVEQPEVATEGQTRLNDGQQFGHYRIIRMLGKGGMGEVYEAEEIDGGRRIALKTMNKSLGDKSARRRFLREGRLAASISHPNSVYVYGTEEIEGTPVIAMELVEGGTLADRVDQRGPLPSEEAADVILDVITGLEAAHVVGVLHRDIKPSNCFVTDDGTVKVGDYGLSLPIVAGDETQLTLTRSLLGTPLCASPEQLQGDELDVRSDIYSVGATLYYLLTGEFPFEADNLGKLIAKVAVEKPKSPRKLRPEIPRRLAKAALRCLAKSPDQRFESYGGLADTLIPSSSPLEGPASSGSRAIVGVVDAVLIFFLALAVRSMLPQGITDPAPLFLGVFVGYFALFEGLWKKTPAKAVFRMRIALPDGGSPTFWRPALRAVLFAGVCAGGFLLSSLLLPPFFAPLSGDSLAETLYDFNIVTILLFLAAFSTARRDNGEAALHDLLSGTRVLWLQPRGSFEVSASREWARAFRDGRPIGRRSWRTRRRPVSAERESTTDLPRAADGVCSKAGYVLLNALEIGAGEEVWEAFDPQLRRPVWIHVPAPGSPAVPEARRSVARRGRPRWIEGKRGGSESWDVYDRTAGAPLLDAVEQTRDWADVRAWLRDLARELGAASEDLTTPSPVALDRIWLGTGNRAMLLDFPVAIDRSGDAPPRIASGQDARTTRQFLLQLARRALTGGAPLDEQDPPDRDPGGRGARAALLSLQDSALDRWHRLIETLDEFVDQRPTVGRLERAVSLIFVALVWFLPLPSAVAGFMGQARGSGPLGWFALLPSAAHFYFASGLRLAGTAAVFAIAVCLLFGGPFSFLDRFRVVEAAGGPASQPRILARSLVAWAPGLVWLAVLGWGPDRPADSWIWWSVELLVGVWAIGLLAVLWTPARGPQERLTGTALIWEPQDESNLLPLANLPA